MVTMNRSKNNPNFSPLSPLSVNLHHQQPTRREEEPTDLFSPKGRPIRCHSSGRRHYGGESSSSRMMMSYPKTPCSSPNPAVKKSTLSSVVTKNSAVPMAVRLRRMKRRLLQEHTKDHHDHQSEEAASLPIHRNL
mmetsp:Transcript_34835/g.84374  ORF Transcript_34835/g.84374 Transcript_34835/m.84374 type:complete len:135 (+) Transcript_34835:77-481(+)